MTADTVVFEIGGVLVDWQPHLAWADDLGENGTRVAQYIHRYTRTVPDKLSATWDPLYALKDKDVTLHAITDWYNRHARRALRFETQYENRQNTLHPRESAL